MPRRTAAASAIEPELDPTVIRLPKKLFTAPTPKPLPTADYLEISANVADLNDADGLFDDFTRAAIEALAEQVDALNAQISDMEKIRNSAAKELSDLLDDQKVRSLSWGNLSANWVHSSNSSLSKDLLMKNGVPSSVIAACQTRKNFRSFRLVNLDRAAENRELKRQAREQAAEEAGE